jgi:hypothetical protein
MAPECGKPIHQLPLIPDLASWLAVLKADKKALHCSIQGNERTVDSILAAFRKASVAMTENTVANLEHRFQKGQSGARAPSLWGRRGPSRGPRLERARSGACRRVEHVTVQAGGKAIVRPRRDPGGRGSIEIGGTTPCNRGKLRPNLI